MNPSRESIPIAPLYLLVGVALVVPFMVQFPDPAPPPPPTRPLDPAAVFEAIRQGVASHEAMAMPVAWGGPEWGILTNAWRRQAPDRVIRGPGWAARPEVSDDLDWEKTHLHVPVPSHVVGEQDYLVIPDDDLAAWDEERENIARVLVFEVPPEAPP